MNKAIISGEGFTIKDGGKPYQYAQQTFKPEQWINDLSGILTDEWAANLKSLAVKHPEMFKSEADVFRVIKEIKDNPTRFFANNNDANALILKDLNSDKAGEIAVRKSDGQIVHTTKNDKSRRLEQLSNRQKRILGNTELKSSDRSARPNRHSDTSRTMATADNAGSVTDESIIPQNSQKVKELPPAELRRAIINAKDDKERLAIIENQKAGIRQRLQREDTMKGKEMLDQKLVERANENSQFNRGSAAQRRLNQTLNEVDKLEISEAKKDAVRKKIISEAQKELRASADLIPSNVSGAAGYNAKKVDRQINAVIKARENKEQILKRAGEKNSRFGSFKADIADSELLRSETTLR